MSGRTTLTAVLSLKHARVIAIEFDRIPAYSRLAAIGCRLSLRDRRESAAAAIFNRPIFYDVFADIAHTPRGLSMRSNTLIQPAYV